MTLTEVQAMTPEEKRVKLAELLGWEIDEHPTEGFDPTGMYPAEGVMNLGVVPDYCNDLNAVHDAWQWMTSNDNRDGDRTAAFEIRLREVVAHGKKDGLRWPYLFSYTINATAEQRTTALILTLSQA